MDSVARVGQIAELAFRPSLVDPQAQALNPHSILSHHQKARTTPNSRGGFSKHLAKKWLFALGFIQVKKSKAKSCKLKKSEGGGNKMFTIYSPKVI